MSIRSCVTALLGVVAVSACSHPVHRTTSVPAAPATVDASPRPASREPVTAGTDRALAVDAAARAFRRFPVPPGSTRLAGAPRGAPHLRRLGAYVGPVEESLTRTGWWLVPMRHERLVAWYAAHTPADVRSTYVPGATAPSPDAVLEWTTDDASPAYSTPVDVVGYTRLGPRLTALRTDVTLAARADRTAATLVPTTVSRIDVTGRALDGPDTSPRTVTVTGRGRVLDVVAAFDSLQGAFASTAPPACASPAGVLRTWAVTFHWPGHTLVVDPGQPLCGVGRGLTRDGRRLRQALADSPDLDAALRAAYDGA